MLHPYDIYTYIYAERVVHIVQERIKKLAKQSIHDRPDSPSYCNIACIPSNFMKHHVSYFYRGQLEKLFLLFPDPHFKRSNYRRRIVNASFLAYYAYILKPPHALLYTITDVYDLHIWMTSALDEHPLFQRLSHDELMDSNDVCYQLIQTATEEGQKVTRIHGKKYPAVYRRIEPSSSGSNS
jgi:tRNA (guanine-N7-)-methyltransferase